jgi:antitoxin (DNA-binding transcriptional repressor) of toxin-antitoxin stability system
MNSITLQEAQAKLVELVHQLTPGAAVTITENDQPVARLVAVPVSPPRGPRPRPPVTGVPKAGSLEGLLVVPEDFKAPLEELGEYME